MSDVNVSFGAQDEGIAAAARKLSNDLAVTERAGVRLGNTSRATSKALGMVTREAIGGAAGLLRFGAAGSILAGVAGGWYIATRASSEYAKVNRAAQHELDVTEKKAEFFLQTIGRGLGFQLDKPLTELGAAASNLVKNTPDAVGVQDEIFARSKEEAALQMELALARTDEEGEFIKKLQDEQRALRDITETYKVLKDAGAIRGEQFGALMQGARAASDARRERIIAAENDRQGQAARDQAREAAAARNAGDDQMRAAFEKEQADRQSLEYMMAEAKIDELRAQGRTAEVTQEQIRLDTLRKINEIKAKEYITDKERAAAIDAVTRASKAELSAAGLTDDSGARRPFTGQQEIAPGLITASASRQVFVGGGSASDPSVKRLEEIKRAATDQLALLKQIERNTSANGATWN